MESLGRHSNHCHRVAVDRNFCADDRRVAAETCHPVRVPENKHGSRIRFLFGWQNKSPERRLDSERREKIARNIAGYDPICFSVHAEAVEADLVCDHPGEHVAGLLADVAIVGHGKNVEQLAALQLISKRGDLLRVFHRQGAQQERIHKAENCSVRADAERQRQDRNSREPWIFSQRPQTVLDILQQ